MNIKIKALSDCSEADITPKSAYLNRRSFMKGALALSALGVAPHGLAVSQYEDIRAYPAPDWLRRQVTGAATSDYRTDEDVTPYAYASRYNNFYEFGTDKTDPYEKAENFVTDPWSVQISGEVNKPGRISFEDILKTQQLEERIYRLRCVEAWSMVIPWIGFPLGKLLQRFEPTGNARYVEFTTLLDPEQMPEQNSFFASIDYPYVEGLRMDEAMHPLTLMAVGMYGETIPPQNGAPLRLVVPWKYGFKSIKSIVRIHFRTDKPNTTWEKTAANEYGFYANVNPMVDHPRWSQAKERRLPGSFPTSNRIPTRLFNGYEEQVGSLYQGMDLNKFF